MNVLEQKYILLGKLLTASNFQKNSKLSVQRSAPERSRSSSATRDKPVSLSTEGEKERGGNDRGKARRSHEISLDRADV